MARSPNKKAEKAHELYKSGMKLVEIASQLNCSAATIRTWKNRYKWDSKESETFQNKNETKQNVSKRKKEKEKAVADEVMEVMENTNLTDRQQLFCIYYIRCFNATKAYQKSYGCNYTTALVNGPKLLGNIRVKEEIRRLKQEKLNREFLSEEDIFQKYMDIAFADMTDFVEFGNEKKNTLRFKNSSDVDGTLICEIKQGKDGAYVKLADRMKALQWLTDHMDMATEKQKAEIAMLKAKVQTPEDTGQDDGFLDALNGTAAGDWSDEES